MKNLKLTKKDRIAIKKIIEKYRNPFFEKKLKIFFHTDFCDLCALYKNKDNKNTFECTGCPNLPPNGIDVCGALDQKTYYNASDRHGLYMENPTPYRKKKMIEAFSQRADALEEILRTTIEMVDPTLCRK